MTFTIMIPDLLAAEGRGSGGNIAIFSADASFSRVFAG
jgi:hypothetical protein